MSDEEFLDALRDAIQWDIGKRGLRSLPGNNLVSATLGDFAAACRSLAEVKDGRVAIVTGFTIPTVDPPRAETDGPPGALFMARAFRDMGMKVCLVSDCFTMPALHVGNDDGIGIVEIPLNENPQEFVRSFQSKLGPLTHLIAIERVGPTHQDQDRCRTMRGRDITAITAPAHLLFEAKPPGVTSIGFGDGGNEIGMGKLPWSTIRDNIPNGEQIACRIATDFLIVAGISNWGGYALAAGVARLRGTKLALDLESERAILNAMVEAAPLVDGVTGRSEATVDGVSNVDYESVLEKIGAVLRDGQYPGAIPG